MFILKHNLQDPIRVIETKEGPSSQYSTAIFTNKAIKKDAIALGKKTAIGMKKLITR